MKSVLFITHITGFLNPGNGGQLRSHHLMKEIAKANSVDVYCDGLEGNVRNHPAWKNLGLCHSVAPSKARLLKQIGRLKGGWRIVTLLNRLFGAPSQKSMSHLPANLSNKWLNQFISQCAQYDFIILDTLQQYPLFSWKGRAAKVWLNAHNVDSILHPKDQRIQFLEHNLAGLIDGVICCTSNDEQRFLEMNSGELSTVVWGNGTSIPDEELSALGSEKAKSVLFVGSLDYEPNIEGIQWYLDNIHEKLLETFYDYSLTIVGRNPSQAFLDYVSRFSGVTCIPNAAEISPLYSNHSMCIVPLLSGSGSRLKIPEALIHNKMVVSTSIGAEGYFQSKIPGLIIANAPVEFFEAVRNTLDLKSAATGGIKEFAEQNYTWAAQINPAEIGLAS